MPLKTRDPLALELDNRLERLDLDFLLLSMELHFLLQDFFLNSTLHAPHARVSHVCTSAVAAPELVRLLVACVWVECAAERKLQAHSTGGLSIFVADLLGRNQVVQFLKEGQVGSLVVVQIQAQVRANLSEPLFTSQDRLLSQQIFPLLLFNLLISLHVDFRGCWVRERRRELVGSIDGLGHGYSRVHVGGDVCGQLLATLLIELHRLEFLVLLIIHDRGAWSHTILSSRSELVSQGLVRVARRLRSLLLLLLILNKSC